MPTKKKAKKATKRKGGSSASKAKFSAAIARAKRIHKDHPGKKWQTCVKEAFKK